MAKTQSLIINIGAKDTASRVLGGIGGKLRGFASGIRGTFSNIGSSLLSGLGIGAGFSLSDKLGQMARDAVMTGVSFEKSMSRVKAITQATDTDFASLNETAMRLGAQTTFSASEVAAAMGEMGSAGMSVQQIIAASPAVLDLAAAGELEMAEAAMIAATALKVFKLPASDMVRVADVLAKASVESATDVRQLGEGFKFAATIADQMGLSIEETVAPLELLAEAGIKGEMAGTGLRQVLSDMSGENVAVNKLFSELGINVDKIKLLPLADKVDVLNSRMSKMSGPEKAGKLIKSFGERAGPAMAALMEKGGDALRKMEAGLRGAGGTAANVAATKLDNVAGSWEQFSGAMETAKIMFFNAIKGPLRQGIDMLASMVQGFAPKIPALIATIRQWLADIAPFVIQTGRTVWAWVVMMVENVGATFTNLGKMIGSAMNAMGLSLPSFKGAGAAILSFLASLEFAFAHWKDFVDIAMMKVILSIIGWKEDLKHTFTVVVPTILTWFADNWQRILKDVGSFTLTVFQNLGSNIVTVMMKLPDLISGKVKFDDIWVKLTKGFETSFAKFPEIAARGMTAVETELHNDIYNQEGALANAYSAHMFQRAGGQSKINETLAGVSGFVGKGLNKGKAGIGAGLAFLGGLMPKFKGGTNIADVLSGGGPEGFAGVAATQQSRFLTGAGARAKDEAQVSRAKMLKKLEDIAASSSRGADASEQAAAALGVGGTAVGVF